MNILGIAGSLRAGSLNRQLLEAAVEVSPTGVDWTLAELAEIPLYNGDLDTDDSKPAAVKTLQMQIASADGLFIVTPEYNYGIPGVLKNAIDWVSRPAYKSVLAAKPVAMASVSMGPVGGARAQAQLKEVLLGVLSKVYAAPELTVGGAGSKFADGKLSDERTLAALTRLVGEFAATLA